MAVEENADLRDGASFDSLKQRLEEIVSEVERDDISLDDALSLYEEAVGIGIAACDASELDIPQEQEQEQEQGATPTGDAAQGESSARDEASCNDGAASEDAADDATAPLQGQPVDAHASASL